jgi:hypothetical protein
VDNWRRWAWSAIGHAALAVVCLAPGAIRSGGGVPGSPHTDLWNSLWGLWHLVEVRGSWHTTLLGAPRGGVVPPADPVNVLLALPLTVTTGPAIAWSALVFGHFVFAALSAEWLAVRRGLPKGGAFVAGVCYSASALYLSHVHNGASESLGIGWLPLALGALQAASSWRAGVGAAMIVAVASLSSPYLAVAVAFAGAIEAYAERSRVAGVALLVGLIAASPWYIAMSMAMRRVDDLVGIKDARELALLRRTIGPADPWAFLWPGGWRSPDFRRISRYGEDYIHAPYLGLVWLALALRAPRSREWLWIVGGLVLACGPVLLHDGGAVLLPGNLGIPLPYLLVERLPGLSSLSLLYRLAVLAQLGVALLVGRVVGGCSPRAAAAVAILGVLDVLICSPLRGGPDWARPPSAAVFQAINAEGSVMNWPVVGGRAYLYEAALHQHPVAGSLNFPANVSARAVFAALRNDPRHAPSVAARHGVAWLVVHDDPTAPPSPEDPAVLAWVAHATPVAAGGGVAVYRLVEK